MNLREKKNYKNIYEEEICVVCRNKYYKSKRKSKGGRKAAFLRPKTAKTCSKECSRIYTDPTIRKKIFPKLS